MKIKLIIVILGFFGLTSNLSDKIKKKVEKEIKSTFEVELVQLSQKLIDAETSEALPSKFNENNFFEIKTNNEILGYAYLSKAPSKTDVFDYLVLLDSNLIVKKTKILIYREDYGGEISSKRWLKQFTGKTEGDELKYQDNIVAISGATISVRSMTFAMNSLLESLKILHEKEIL